ncbi:MAG: M28 family peptidase [Elusimicrobia bacterium]|nr:M28 family peptidase [Elusimicrobiota bacterium]
MSFGRRALPHGLAFLAALSVVFYPRLLDGPVPWARTSGWALLVAGLAFLGISSLKDAGFWSPVRCRVAALGGVLWGLYLLLYAGHNAPWLLDLVFFIIAACILLGRHRPEFLISGVGILGVVGIRHAQNRYAVVLLDIAFLAAVLRSAPAVEAMLARSSEEARSRGAGEPQGGMRKLVRVGVPAALFVFLAVYAVRPTYLMVSPEKRRRMLESLAPRVPASEPAKLSPLASRLREHVVFLAGKVGERSAYQPDAGKKARDYVVGEFRKAGYAPRVLEYDAGRKTDFVRRQHYANVEAELGAGGSELGWLIGAHFDTAPGTPGADDNASAVAVLLETARLLKERAPSKGVRFVAFDTEEPPAFATRDMGSYRYAKRLQAEGVKVRGVIILEMLGYFNDKPRSQLHPPILELFYPNRGDFVGVASNLSSSGLMAGFLRSWRKESRFPIEGVVFPSIFSTLPISDQLNFWWEGYPALMLSDSAFFRNPHYHQTSDTPDTLDYERMASVTEALAEVLASDLR